MDAGEGRSTMNEPVFDAFIDYAGRMRWSELRAATRHAVKRELLDYFGAAIAGRAAAGMPAWLRVLIDMGGRPDARVMGGPRVPAPIAALCNGYFGHVLEFDDTHDEAVLHAGSAPIPAALAAAGVRGGVSGREFCESVLLGIELNCRLGVGTRLSLVEGGWIYTALLGHFGATLAAAYLIDRRAPILRNALGIAYCLASGNHQSTREGAPTKHVQPGFAAGNAVTAALMASAGLDGVQQPLTGEDGLSRVYLHERLQPERVLDGLGERFETERLSFKPYPTCRLTHPAISAALELRAALGPAAAEVDHVELCMGPQAHNVVGRDTAERRTPATRVAAQFSVYWAVAVALHYGELTPAQLAAEVPPSPELQRLIQRISGSAQTAAGERDVGGCVLRARGAFGERQVTHHHAKGHPDSPLSDDELLAKFRGNLRYAGVDDGAALALADDIMAMDLLDDVTPLVDRIAGMVARTAPVA